MTRCRACGHNSFMDDFCEGCRRPLDPGIAMPPGSAQPTVQMQPPARRVSLTGEVFESAQPPLNGPQPMLQMPPQSQTVRRVALTGEVVETTQAILPRQAPGMPPGTNPAYRAGPSLPAHPGQPMGGAAMLPAAAYSAAAMSELAATGGPSLGARWEKALAIALPIVALSMVLVHFVPIAMFAVVFALLFVVPVVLGATGAIPRYEDAIVDCSIMLVAAFVGGPLIALGAYLVYSLVRQECNIAIVALLGLNLLIKGLFSVAFAPTVDTLALAMMWGLMNMLGFFGVCLSFLGWLASSFFRDLNS